MKEIQRFYEVMEQDEVLAERVERLTCVEGTIEKILEGTVCIAREYGFAFTLAELKLYLIQKEDIEIV